MPLRNADRSSIGWGLYMQLPGASAYTRVPNVVDIEFDFPSAPVESQKYVDGDASQFHGTADPATMTCNVTFNPISDEYDALNLSKKSGDTLPFYVLTGAENKLFGNTNKVTITGPGAVTFDATGSKPNFGRNKNTYGRFGAGDCIKIGNKYYKISALTGSVPNEVPTVKDLPHGGGNANVAVAVATATVYSIVRPQLKIEFIAGVSTLGGASASPSSPAAGGGQLTLALQNASDDDWVLVPTA